MQLLLSGVSLSPETLVDHKRRGPGEMGTEEGQARAGPARHHSRAGRVAPDPPRGGAAERP